MSNYDAAAKSYDRAHGSPHSRKRFAKIEAPILEAARGANAVLEVGVGTGRLLSQLQAPRRVGIDPSAGMLAEAAKHRGLELVQGDAHRMPFASGAFDAVIAGKGVFRYLKAPAAFEECARVLRPGGTLAVHQYSASTWSLRGLLGMDSTSPQTRAMHIESPQAFESAAVEAGFVQTRIHLFRSVRFFPYAVEIPRAIAGRLWSHIVLVATTSSSMNL